MKASVLTAGAAFISSVAAGPSSFGLSDTLKKRAPCAGNTPDSRQQWCEFNINTDWHHEVPDTGVVREYWLDLREVDVNPDGVLRKAITANGTIPGPTLTGNWGDTMVVHVTNNFRPEGVSIHWHGLRQNRTSLHDGAVSITQCALAPNDTMTYTFRLTQYGTTWYHSHFALQAWDGLFGPIVINGPASANYDEDLGPIILSDWFHRSAKSLFGAAQTRGPPPSQNGLINGLNIYDAGGAQNATGSRFQATMTPGKSHRLRLVNVAIDTHWKFFVDNHTMTVIAMDLVPIKPYQTTMINIGIAQRYDVIITANQEAVATDFWMRAVPQAACSASNQMSSNIRGIIHYGSSRGTPNTTAWNFVDECVDEHPTKLKAVVAKDVAPEPFYQALENVSVGRNAKNFFRWFMNGTTLEVQWGDPTLGQIMRGSSAWNRSQNVVQLDEANKWAYLIVQTAIGVSHPIHLHGHDFFVLEQGTGTFNRAKANLTLTNPPRRDTALLPGSGYLVMAWETDNPGAWLLHCHIGWHTVQGLAMQFVERLSEIPATVNNATLGETCNKWGAYAIAGNITVDDSGV